MTSDANPVVFNILPEFRRMVALSVHLFRYNQDLGWTVIYTVPATLAPLIKDFHYGLPFILFLSHILSSSGMLGEGINAYIKNIAVSINFPQITTDLGNLYLQL